MTLKILPAAIGSFLLLISSCNPVQKKVTLTKYVDPFIGTGGHGHTYPGATLPFGMVQLSPDTDVEGWDWCSGYHSNDSSIMGFSHTHLSGTGAPDMGDILIMPFSGNASLVPGKKDSIGQGYRSRFTHESEIARPGYYAVKLEDCDVYAELTASLRVGFHRYTFSGDSATGLVIDLEHGIGDKPVSTSIKLLDDHTIAGYRRSTGFIVDHCIYFCAEFSNPIGRFTSYSDGQTGSKKSVEGVISKAILNFNTRGENKLLVKVGLSTVSESSARNNITKEIPGWDFDKISAAAQNTWEKQLSKIEIETDNEDQRTIFYTALYHSMVCPNLISDVDGSYMGWDGNPHQDTARKFYTNFSLWDTYRALHPLLSLIDPDQNLEFINSMIERNNQVGSLPMIEYGIKETYCMIGYHAIPVLAQAILEDKSGFDYYRTLDAMKFTAMRDTLGIDLVKKYKFIPGELESNSVSKQLEYAYDDWCIAQVAKKLGREEDYAYFTDRAKYYRNHFDSTTGFMRGRHANGDWRVPFDPKNASVLGSGDFTEGNSWQYSFYVPQDVAGLMELMGGEQSFCSKLDDLFTAPVDDKGPGVVDVTGLVGQYAHGNEPSHHIAYLYTFAGQPWKTQQYVNRIKNELYGNSRDGLCGNDDCGQMSAWYVYSALGFYPVTPGSGYYVIGTPSFRSAKLNLPGGRQFKVEASGGSQENYYIGSAKLNNAVYSKTFIDISKITKGGTLTFNMTETPQTEWGTNASDRPYSAVAE